MINRQVLPIVVVYPRLPRDHNLSWESSYLTWRGDIITHPDIVMRLPDDATEIRCDNSTPLHGVVRELRRIWGCDSMRAAACFLPYMVRDSAATRRRRWRNPTAIDVLQACCLSKHTVHRVRNLYRHTSDSDWRAYINGMASYTGLCRTKLPVAIDRPTPAAIYGGYAADGEHDTGARPTRCSECGAQALVRQVGCEIRVSCGSNRRLCSQMYSPAVAVNREMAIEMWNLRH